MFSVSDPLSIRIPQNFLCVIFLLLLSLGVHAAVETEVRSVWHQELMASGLELIPEKPDGWQPPSLDTPSIGMDSLEESELAALDGQAFIWSDRIAPNSLTGASSLDGKANFTFMRMGLDAEIAMNANIAKMQLGCGGVNENILSNACDIDIDYARLMGRDGYRGANQSSGDPTASDFILNRPYIEVAIKNDNSPTNREVVGIKIGAAMVDGFLGVGRVYEQWNTTNATGCNNQGANCTTPGTNNYANHWNMEHNVACNPQEMIGAGNPGFISCHSGVNTLSGFVGAEMSATLPITAVGVSGTGCAGNTAHTGDICGPGDRLFLDYSGTRIQDLVLSDLSLKANLIGISLDGYAKLTANTRMLHGFAMVETTDFFLSFQREQVAYPRYSKTIPTASDAPICGTNYAPNRCSAAYAVPANTGWWMNIPDAKLMDVVTDRVSFGLFDLGALLSAFSRPGLVANNPDFNLNPPRNCHGGAMFC